MPVNSQYCVPEGVPLRAAKIAVEVRLRDKGPAHARVSDPENRRRERLWVEASGTEEALRRRMPCARARPRLGSPA